MITGVQTLRTQDTSDPGHFGPRTLRTQDTSDLGHFGPRTLRQTHRHQCWSVRTLRTRRSVLDPTLGRSKVSVYRPECCRSSCHRHSTMWTHHAAIETTALVACVPAHLLQADDSGAPGIVRTGTRLPHWRLPARGITIIQTMSLYCTTLQHHVWQTMVQCGWPTSVEQLVQRSLQHRTFNHHFGKHLKMQLFPVSWCCGAFATVWFLCAVYVFLLTYLPYVVHTARSTLYV